jgi:hypothetical protein
MVSPGLVEDGGTGKLRLGERERERDSSSGIQIMIYGELTNTIT